MKTKYILSLCIIYYIWYIINNILYKYIMFVYIHLYLYISLYDMIYPWLYQTTNTHEFVMTPSKTLIMATDQGLRRRNVAIIAELAVVLVALVVV